MAKKSGSKSQPLVVQSKVKDVVRKAKMKCSSDVIDAINHVVQTTLLRGCDRARANGRKTLRGADL